MLAHDPPTENLLSPIGSRLTVHRLNHACTLLRLPSTPEELTEHWFDPAHWEAQGKTVDRQIGRKTVYFFAEKGASYVLRHFWRGGFIGKLIQDSYLFTGIRRSRIYRELDLLSKLDEMQLPVCKPISAILTRHGLTYRGSIITRAIPNASNLLEILRQQELTNNEIVAIAKMLAVFHRKGLDHADLNIGNVLLDTDGQPFLVDFDRGRIRQPKRRWQRANIKRLHRSFTKQQRLNPGFHWTMNHWRLLMTTYVNEMSQ